MFNILWNLIFIQYFISLLKHISTMRALYLICLSGRHNIYRSNYKTKRNIVYIYNLEFGKASLKKRKIFLKTSLFAFYTCFVFFFKFCLFLYAVSSLSHLLPHFLCPWSCLFRFPKASESHPPYKSLVSFIDILRVAIFRMVITTAWVWVTTMDWSTLKVFNLYAKYVNIL